MIAHVYKPRRKKNGKTVSARLYRGRFRLDGDLFVTEVPLRTSDRQTAQKRLKEIIAEKERERAGVLAPRAQRVAAQRPLREHLEDFLGDLGVRGRSAKHIEVITARIRRIMEECAWRSIGDIDPNGFLRWRSAQQRSSPKTLNEYLNAFSSFLNWMVRQGRIANNPLVVVEKVDVRGRQLQRRAFTDEELQRLLSVAGSRRLLYLTAAYTGLRLGELKQLHWSDLVQHGERVVLHVRASTTKNRKDALLPLVPKLQAELEKARAGHEKPTGLVFRIPAHPHRIFRRDLETAGIRRFDDLGRKVDFHALRHTFATNLARAGVSQRLAQELMRHSEPQLTARIYTDASRLPTAEAVDKLPWLDSGEEALRDPQIDPQKLVSEGLGPSPVDTSSDCGVELEVARNEQLVHELSATGTDGQMVRAVGIEPTTPAWKAGVLPLNYARRGRGGQP